MTATIRPPERGSLTRKPLRFSSLESLGFSSAASIWSDPGTATPVSSPATAIPVLRRGRHEAAPHEPETVADWRPEDFGGRLTGGNVRWGLVAMVIVLLAGAVGFGYWLYQRPALVEEASAAELVARANALDEVLPELEEFNQNLLSLDPATGTSSLFSVESEARALFEASGGLADTQSEMRRASSEAAGSALDGVRLINEAHSYRSAVLPILTLPDLETDPELIALDEAARAFGDWQLVFDDVRSALPESVMSDVTRRLDMLAGNLDSILTNYVDALREDNPEAAQGVLSDLGGRLGEIHESMDSAIEDVQTRVTTRVEETRHALEAILGG